jgi:peptidoglycan/LPS O-acetylase OafA/YrhL
MFFVLSGSLICRSALRSRSVTRFLWHRSLCIFPGYWVFPVVFVAGTYLVMCNIRYGMNLRYTTMWDMPLRYLAMITVWDLTRSFGQRKELAAGIATTLLCVFDLRQYDIFFVQGGL